MATQPKLSAIDVLNSGPSTLLAKSHLCLFSFKYFFSSGINSTYVILGMKNMYNWWCYHWVNASEPDLEEKTWD